MDHDPKNPNHPEDTSPKTPVYIIATVVLWLGCFGYLAYLLVREALWG